MVCALISAGVADGGSAAYTSPAIGHLFPFCALLGELAARGHQIHVRTLASGVGVCRRLGFAAERVDPRVEALQSDDWSGPRS